MAKRKRTRAAGGGRKPQGEFAQLTSPFSLRMPDDLREQLEAAAAKSGRSASQELLRRLYDSFGINRDKTREPGTRALCFLLAELADDLCFAAPPGWHRSPHMFRAFKIGFAKLLDAIEPKGEEPPELKKFIDTMRKESDVDYLKALAAEWESPQHAAKAAVARTLSDLYRGPSMSPDEVRAFWTDDISKDERVLPFAELDVQQTERTLYGMSDVRRDLELTKRPEAEPKRITKTKL